VADGGGTGSLAAAKSDRDVVGDGGYFPPLAEVRHQHGQHFDHDVSPPQAPSAGARRPSARSAPARGGPRSFVSPRNFRSGGPLASRAVGRTDGHALPRQTITFPARDGPASAGPRAAANVPPVAWRGAGSGNASNSELRRLERQSPRRRISGELRPADVCVIEGRRAQARVTDRAGETLPAPNMARRSA
jgi:hypothetical protein